MNRQRVLVVASAGGHWVQLLRLRPAFEDQDLAFLTTTPGYRDDVRPHRYHAVNDASRWDKFRLAVMAVRILLVVLRERPNAIITTGAACGYFALRFGKLIGARTMWIDSIANIDEVSMSGQLARPYADRCLTQWAHLAVPGRVEHEGAVL